MPGIDPVSAVSSGIGGVFNYAGAKEQAKAQTHAADLNAAAVDKAENFLEGQKAKQESAWVPYGAAGSQAASTLPSMIRQSPQMGAPMPYTTQPRATMGAPLAQIGQSPMGQVAAPSGGTVAPGSAGGMVMLQAPDGTQKQVPQQQAQFYIAKGAKQVG